MSNNKPISIIIIGSSNSDKEAMLQYFINNIKYFEINEDFSSHLRKQIRFNQHIIELDVNNQSEISIDTREILLLCDSFIYLFDSNKQANKNKMLYERTLLHCGKVYRKPIFYVANRKTLNQDETIKNEHCSTSNYPYYEISTLTGENIYEIFHLLMREIMNQQENRLYEKRKIKIEQSHCLCF